MVHDLHNLQRFLDAQELVYPTALAELHAGRKQTHWIWFIFPQVAGLGRSSTAQYYAIRSRGEALDYVTHPLLGLRLIECTKAILGITNRSAYDIFGAPDDMKFRSSMTLFGTVSELDYFENALDRFYEGQPDDATLDILDGWHR